MYPPVVLFEKARNTISPDVRTLLFKSKFKKTIGEKGLAAVLSRELKLTGEFV